VLAEIPRSRAGGLADRLVDATEALLAEEGLPGLGLRAIARRAGVTHGAPLRHYESLAALLSEVARRGFVRLTEAVDEEAGAVAPAAGPRELLSACARAYLRCAVASPDLFALMFRPDMLDFEHPGLARDSRAAFEQLVRHVRSAQDRGWQTGRDTRRLAGALWSSMHGLALLWAQGAFPAVVPGTSLDEALATTLDLVLADPEPRSTP
jgi:AcrR family transcriptional regulator